MNDCTERCVIVLPSLNPNEKFEIICWEWQKDFYKRVLPENVSYYIVEETGESRLIL